MAARSCTEARHTSNSCFQGTKWPAAYDRHAHACADAGDRRAADQGGRQGHHHADADGANATLDVNGVVYRPFPRGGYDIPRRLKDMDATRRRRARAVGDAADLSLQSGACARAPPLAAIQNDQMAKHVAAHPDRFMAIATLPMQAPASAADELRARR